MGYVSLELGSDIGGSLRAPAHYYGVYAHKPTHAPVPSRGHTPPGYGSSGSSRFGNGMSCSARLCRRRHSSTTTPPSATNESARSRGRTIRMKIRWSGPASRRLPACPRRRRRSRSRHLVCQLAYRSSACGSKTAPRSSRSTAQSRVRRFRAAADLPVALGDRFETLDSLQTCSSLCGGC